MCGHFELCRQARLLSDILARKKKGKCGNLLTLSFIATNGPFVSLSLVDGILDTHLGANWHFTLNQDKKAKNVQNSFAQLKTEKTENTKS